MLKMKDIEQHNLTARIERKEPEDDMLQYLDRNLDDFRLMRLIADHLVLWMRDKLE